MCSLLNKARNLLNLDQESDIDESSDAEQNEIEKIQESRGQDEKDNDNIEEVTRRTSARPKSEIRKPNRCNYYVVYANHCGAIVTESYEDAINNKEFKKWKDSMRQ